MQLSNFNGRRLRRAWWLTPPFITCSLFIAFDMIIAMVMNHKNAYGVSDFNPADSAEIALVIAGFFGLIGLLRGFSFASSTSRILKAGLGVSDLPENHSLARRVQRLASTLGLPPPKVAIMQRDNAYAIGSSPKDAAVVIGLPFIQGLNADELDAIIGHELGHIISGDMRRMQFAEAYQQTMADFCGELGRGAARNMKSASTASLVHNLGVLARRTVFLVGELIVKSTSRNREYVADAIGAMLTSPAAMSSALVKIHNLPPKPSVLEDRYACLMVRGRSKKLFSTHPTLEQRLASLEAGNCMQKLINRACGRGHVAQAGKGVRRSARTFATSFHAAWPAEPQISRDIHGIA